VPRAQHSFVLLVVAAADPAGLDSQQAGFVTNLADGKPRGTRVRGAVCTMARVVLGGWGVTLAFPNESDEFR